MIMLNGNVSVEIMEALIDYLAKRVQMGYLNRPPFVTVRGSLDTQHWELYQIPTVSSTTSLICVADQPPFVSVVA